MSKQRAEKMAQDHWNYVKGILQVCKRNEMEIEACEYHYKTAFIHGYGHAVEDYRYDKTSYNNFFRIGDSNDTDNTASKS